MVGYEDRFRLARERMLREHLRERGIRDERVLEAMGRIRREEFLTVRYKDCAYDDRPLPIGMGQTISQPYIVALMTESLDPKGTDEVLEIDTGCGYQTAVLAELVRKVYTMERHHGLAEPAQSHLENLGINNVEFAVGDGSEGWPEEKVFDKIIVTAALPSIPGSMNEQLKEGGIIVAPVGGQYSQQLMRYEKKGESFETQSICGCRFVKLIGRYGFKE